MPLSFFSKPGAAVACMRFVRTRPRQTAASFAGLQCHSANRFAAACTSRCAEEDRWERCIRA